MERLVVVISILGILTWGFIKIVMKLRGYSERLELSEEFLEKLISYVDSGGQSLSDYSWMIHRSNKMQNYLGSLGIIHSYKPPYQNVMYSNYPIILNMLPDLRISIEDEILRSVASQYANSLQEALVRNIGCVEDRMESCRKELKNPFKWLREGVREIVSVPVYILSWLGIVSDSMITKIISSNIFKALSGVIALIGFVSAIITIAIGWDEFLVKLFTIAE